MNNLERCYGLFWPALALVLTLLLVGLGIYIIVLTCRDNRRANRQLRNL